MDYDSDDEEVGTPESTNNCVMHKYLNSIQDQIQVECNTKKKINDSEKWLLNFLNKNDFWIRKEVVSSICEQLNIEVDLPGYYNDL